MSLLTSYEIDWSNFLQFNGNGVVVATYAEIYKALVKKFQDIWGSDIDLSSASADGVFVNTYALIINNILLSFKKFYESLNVNTATGAALDVLCNLTNVTRKPATASTCPVVLTLDNSETENYITNEIDLVDINGNIWIARNIEGFVLEPGVPQTIVFTCSQLGPIEAPKGTIDRLINNDVVINIEQSQDANKGFNVESDSSLRKRRTQTLGSRGTTVLESLSSSLLSLTGIRDVKIYNNDTGNEITAKDGTKIVAHNVYIIVRRESNITISDATIGTIIYEKMTPGISTTKSQDQLQFGNSHEYQYVQRILGQRIDSDIKQIVYWKEATPTNNEIKIVITPNVYFASYDNSTAKKIAQKVINYMNNKLIGENIESRDLWNIVQYADPKFRGSKTYDINNITIGGSDIYTNPDTYYGYTKADYEVSDEEETKGQVTIKIN